MPASCTVCLYCKSFKYRRCASVGIRRTAVFVESGCKGTHFFPNTQTFRGFFFVKKDFSGLSLTWVKGTGRAYILYIYAHGREGQAPQPSCGEQDGRDGRDGGDGRETEPRSKTAGHSGYSCRFWKKHLERLAEALWVYIFFTIVVCILFLKVIIGRKCLWNG